MDPTTNMDEEAKSALEKTKQAAKEASRRRTIEYYERNKRLLEQQEKPKPPNPRNEDIAGACINCDKDFDNTSKFLMHISHSKLCYEAHDPKIIDNIRREARLRSKRKWFAQNWESRIKGERKAAYQAGKKPKYVPASTKKSKYGMVYSSLVKNIYGLQMKEVKQRLESIFLRDNEYKNMVNVEALEFVFNDDIFNILKGPLPPYAADGPTIFEHAFCKLEKAFSDKFEKEYADFLDNWGRRNFAKITENLLEFIQDKAFKTCYYIEGFKSLYARSSDAALDKVFFELIMKEEYFPDDNEELEVMMSKVFARVLNEEVLRLAEETEEFSKIENLVKTVVEKRFKSFESVIIYPEYE